MIKVRGCIVVLALAGCDMPGREPIPENVALDALSSSGKVIEVPVASVAGREEWGVGSAPLTVITAAENDPDYDFYNVVGVYRLSDGRIAMAPGPGPIRIYGAAGVHQLTFSRKGAGPGEFQQIVKLGVLDGDSIAVFDNVLGRISIFTGEGRFARSLHVSGETGQRTGVFLPEGSFVGERRTTSSQAQEGGGAVRERVNIVLRSLEDNSTAVIGTVPGMIMTSTGSVPFSPSAIMAAGRNRIYVTASDVYEIHVYESSGRQIHQLRADLDPAKVTRAEARGSSTLPGLSEADRVAYEQHRRTVAGKEASHHRVIRKLMADGLDFVWVLPDERVTGTDGKKWFIYDIHGQFVTTFPDRINGGSLIGVGTDYVITGQLGEAGYTSIEVWPLIRNGE